MFPHARLAYWKVTLTEKSKARENEFLRIKLSFANVGNVASEAQVWITAILGGRGTETISSIPGVRGSRKFFKTDRNKMRHNLQGENLTYFSQNRLFY